MLCSSVMTAKELVTNSTTTAAAVIQCRRLNIMRDVVQTSSVYLYPCTVQYSLVATGTYSTQYGPAQYSGLV